MSTPTPSHPITTNEARAPTEFNDQYLQTVFDGGLSENEIFWRAKQKWIEEHGYMLRPRFHPEWVPSWKGSNKLYMKFEDGSFSWAAFGMLDAKRISDGEIVCLKKVRLRDPSLGVQPELKMGPLFQTEPYASDPRNHCVPIYDTLTLPEEDNMVLLVMPFLYPWDSPLFETVGETIEFCRQVFEGLQFMHSHNIAHNDVKYDNIMADIRPLYDVAVHPTSRRRTYDWKIAPPPKSRTHKPIKYYFIDFDLCEQYDASMGSPQREPPYGGDLTVPEFAHKPSKPCNPFAVDVYRLGNIIRERITGGSSSDLGKQKLDPTFKFLHPLIADMTQDDPAKRPTMNEVVTRFNNIIKGLSEFKLRSRVSTVPANATESPRLPPVHWFRQSINFITRVPAIPTPKLPKK